MSDPGIDGPMAEFERRAALLFAHSAACQSMLGANNATEALEKILVGWDVEAEGDAFPVAPVMFVTPDYNSMRLSPERNIDGPVMISVHVLPPSEYADNKVNGRRWFLNQLGTLASEVISHEGQPIQGSSGTHLRLMRLNSNYDGITITGWPCWGDPREPLLPKGSDGQATLIAALEVHLES